MEYTKIIKQDGMYIAYVNDVEITKASTASKCAGKLFKWLKSQGQ